MFTSDEPVYVGLYYRMIESRLRNTITMMILDMEMGYCIGQVRTSSVASRHRASLTPSPSHTLSAQKTMGVPFSLMLPLATTRVLSGNLAIGRCLKRHQLRAHNIAAYMTANGLPDRFIVDQGRVADHATRQDWSEWCNIAPAGFAPPPGPPQGNLNVDSIV